MEDLKITKDIAIRCVLFGACKIPKVGRLFNSFSTSDLIWAERIFVKKELAKFKTPLWLCSGDGGSGGGGGGGGYGYGSGGGDGDGVIEKILKVA